jgi:PhnB protein
MTQISAYLNFNGNCREAMTFYKESFGGELILQAVEGSPLETQCPAAMKHHVVHAVLVKDELLLMGSDMVGAEGFHPGNTMALSLECSSEKEINTFFSRLSSGGQIAYPLHRAFWGGTFGILTDKFGIKWMFNYDEKK